MYALLTGVLVISGVPLAFAQLRTVCDGTACAVLQLTTTNAVALQDRGISLTFYAMMKLAPSLVLALVTSTIAAILIWRRPDDRVALLLAFIYVALGASNTRAPEALAAVYPALWLPSQLIWFVQMAGLIPLFCLLPDGRFVPHWSWWVALGQLGLYLPLFVPRLSSQGSLWFSIIDWLLLPSLVFIVGIQIFRYRRVSNLVQRQQTKWVLYGMSTQTAMLLAPLALVPFFPTTLQLGTPANVALNVVGSLAVLISVSSFGIAILRYRLFDIDLLINRTLVYGALTVTVVGLYVVIVGGFGALLQTRGSPVMGLLATGLVAVIVQPLHARLRRGVNHLMYGERDEPYAVLARLGQRLEATLAPEAVLPTIVATVREALKLPYAAITLAPTGATSAAASGRPIADLLHIPLSYQGMPVGQLLLAPRAPGEPWSPADRRLLQDLAHHAGIAVHGVRLVADLQRSRERLVLAREDERRRLRRDLHDDLAPTLAGLAITASTVEALIPIDSSAATALVADLRTAIRAAVGDIRRLVYDLRPPTLDELGLVAAIRERAVQYSVHRVIGATPDAEIGLDVIVDAPAQLPPLPAAVEVAAYRIVQEALANVTHHAEARSCRIRLAAADDGLQVAIVDDGIGLPAKRRPGVGLRSMQERAAELGGTCVIEALPGGGTEVRAWLPLGHQGTTEEEYGAAAHSHRG